MRLVLLVLLVPGVSEARPEREGRWDQMDFLDLRAAPELQVQMDQREQREPKVVWASPGLRA